MEKFFFHHIRRTDGAIDKNIDIFGSFDAAKKAFRQFMGNYAYGQSVITDMVQAFVTDANGSILAPYDETWIAQNFSGDVFFMHRIRHDKSQEDANAWVKGIEVKDNYNAAKQAFNAYLGAYAYQQTEETANFDLVDCRITDGFGAKLMNETWAEPQEEPEPEPVV
jgi:K+-transporting ATPase c subunit